MADLMYRFGHIGINRENGEAAKAFAQQLQSMFGFPAFDTGGAIFVQGSFEVMKENGRGAHGHIAIETDDLIAAMADMGKKGVMLDMESLRSGPDGEPISVYLTREIGGFAVHLLRRPTQGGKGDPASKDASASDENSDEKILDEK